MIIEILKYALLIIGGYLLGTVSGAKIISKIRKDDITKHGSGNPGSMNMLRTFGFKWGILTLCFDAIKGAIPSLVGFYVFGGDFSAQSYVGLYVGGLSAVVGHCFPVFSKFKGGKGVACMLGMFAVAEPYWALVVFAVCFVYLLIFDYGAMASFLFITALTVIEGYKFKGNLPIAILLFIAYFLVWFMHRQNIFRLLIGKENKVNFISKLKKLGGKHKLPKDEKKQIKE
ncbi:MAG: glycerol-3-phosphate 1-O-acyltransferase PlsY, partial [Clostridia bacterium]|nr:glycerol-3-phosphate 1-O-acyltransferase PlsY [Clostridia bacterium]